MDRCALFVDASYALADGAMAVHGTRRRDSVSWNHAGLLTLLAGLAKDRTGLPVLRCYWYETAAEGDRTPEQEALAEMPGLKLRLVNVRPGRREGIETAFRRDLVTLAKNGAISDAFIASADEHLAEIVTEVQDLGVRVVTLHISADGGWTIPQPLRQECDDIVEISGVHLRPFVELIRGAEPATAEEIAAPAAIAGGPAALEAAVGALPYRGAALPTSRSSGYSRPDAPVPVDVASAGAAPVGQHAILGPGTSPHADHRSSGVYPAHARPAEAGPVHGAHSLADPAPVAAGLPAPASAYASGAGQPNAPMNQASEQPGQSASPLGLVPGGQSALGAVQAYPALSYLGGPTPPDPPASYLGSRTPPDTNASYSGEMPSPDRGAGYPGGMPSPDPNAGYLNGTQHGGGPSQQAMARPGYPGGAYNGTPMSGPLDMAPGSPQNGVSRNDYQAAPDQNGMPVYGGVAPNGVPSGRDQTGRDQTGRDQTGRNQTGRDQTGRNQTGRNQTGRDQNGPVPSYQEFGTPPVGIQPPGAQPPGAQLPNPAVAGSRGETDQHTVGAYGAPPAGYGSGSSDIPGYQNGNVPPGGQHPNIAQNGVYQLGAPQRGAGYPNGVPQGAPGQAGPPMYPAPVPPGVILPGPVQMPGNGFPPHGQYAVQPQSAAPLPVRAIQAVAISLPEAVQTAYAEGFNFGESVGREAPGLWLDAVIARKPRMPSDLEARLLQGSALPIDSLLHDEVRHSLRRGFWDSLESARQ